MHNYVTVDNVGIRLYGPDANAAPIELSVPVEFQDRLNDRSFGLLGRTGVFNHIHLGFCRDWVGWSVHDVAGCGLERSIVR